MIHNWLRAFHIVFMVAWFAGLFYIFRLFVYHVENKHKPEVVRVLTVMERKLYTIICWPGLVVTTAFGVGLWSQRFSMYLAQPWFVAKLAAVVALVGYHLYAGKIRKDLAASRCRLTSRQCRAINEVPTFLLLAIVILAVVKPFQ